MQNQQEDTFVFGQSVKGFLERYQADAKFGQEARKKAAGVLDGNVQLICPDDIRPLAMRLLARLMNSDVVLFSFYSSAANHPKRAIREQIVRKEFGQRLRNNPNFAKFVLNKVALAAASGGCVKLFQFYGFGRKYILGEASVYNLNTARSCFEIRLTQAIF